MSRYRRARYEGGTFFFTVNLADRSRDDLVRHIDRLRKAYATVKHGYVSRVCDWPHCSFGRYVERGLLPPDWGGDMRELSGAFGE